ncbi:hypothetical protein [Streptomyces sp. NPDC088400]|uniref:hypothetical protein n=1 Tax=Streptomyces sp. NPDC088400 TaxID=3365861 RepID=UPI00380B6AD5
MLRTALHRLTRTLRDEPSGSAYASGSPTPGSARPPRRVQLPLPPTLPATLGCDAVGVPAQHGFRLMARLPRTGCVFADADMWWWIVPAGSNLDLTWPSPVRYVAGTTVPATHPRLIHWPEAPTPYTPPIPFYLMVCQLMGTAPAWTEGVRGTPGGPGASAGPGAPGAPGTVGARRRV